MGVHFCPIEPDDWSNGPDCGPECRECEGTGEICVNNGDDRDVTETCPRCGGSGFVDLGDYEPQPDDVI